MASFTTLFITSVLCVAKLVLLMGSGFYLAVRGKIDARGVQSMNVVAVQLLVPCQLFVSLCQATSLEALTQFWVLPAAAACHIALGFLLGGAVAQVGRLEAHRAPTFVMSCAFGNANAFPFVLLGTVVDELMPGNPGARMHGNACIGFYLLCWSFSCWTVGYSYMASTVPIEQGTDTIESVGDFQPAAYKQLEGDGNSKNRASLRESFGRALAGCRVGLAKTLTPPVIGLLLGFAVGLTPLKMLLVGEDAPLQEVFRLMQMLGSAGICLATLTSGAVLYTGRSAGHASIFAGVTCVEAVLAVLLRSVLIPLVSWLACCCIKQAGWLSQFDDPLLIFVVLLQGAMPTANNAVLIAQATHGNEKAQMAALLMICQVMIAPVALTCWIFVFLQTSYSST